MEKRCPVTAEVAGSIPVIPANSVIVCCSCRLPKDENEFSAKHRKTGKKQGRCKAYQSEYGKQHYLDNKVDYQVRISDYKRSIARAIQVAKEKPCTDCGVQYPYYVMHFDHLGDKEFGISGSRMNFGLTRIMAEIAKCEVVCANCHAERTHKRETSETFA